MSGSAADRAGARCRVIPADKGSLSFAHASHRAPSEGTLGHSRNGPWPDDWVRAHAEPPLCAVGGSSAIISLDVQIGSLCAPGVARIWLIWSTLPRAFFCR